MNPYDSQRCTGRTTKMLVNAIKAALEGKRVLVVSANIAQLGHIMGMLPKVFSTTFPGTGTTQLRRSQRSARFSLSGGEIKFETIYSEEMPSVRGRHFDKSFVDHFCWEGLWQRLEARRCELEALLDKGLETRVKRRGRKFILMTTPTQGANWFYPSGFETRGIL